MVLLIVWLLVIPLFSGILPAHFVEKKNNSISTVYVCGWITMLAVFQMVSSVFTLIGGTLTDVDSSFAAVISVVALMGAFILVNGFIKSDSDSVSLLRKRIGLKTEEKILWILFALIFSVQIISIFFVYSPSTEDAYYLSVALTAEEEDCLFEINPYTGNAASHALSLCISQFPIFIAFISRMSSVHVAIVAHSILPVALIILTYSIFYKIGTELFKDNSGKIAVFMVLMAGLELFGGSSNYSSETMLLARTWQGKSIFANVAIPALFYFFVCIGRIYYENREYEKKRITFYYVLIGLTNLVAIFASTLGALFMMIPEIIIPVILSIKFKNKRLLSGIICILPCLIYIFIYLSRS